MKNVKCDWCEEPNLMTERAPYLCERCGGAHWHCAECGRYWARSKRYCAGCGQAGRPEVGHVAATPHGGLDIQRPLATRQRGGGWDLSTADAYYLGGRNVVCTQEHIVIAPPPLSAVNRTMPFIFSWRGGKAQLSLPVFLDGHLAVVATNQGAFAYSTVAGGEAHEILGAESVCCMAPVHQHLHGVDYVWFGVEAYYQVELAGGWKRASASELTELVRRNEVTRDTRIWVRGRTGWNAVAAGEFEALERAFSGGSMAPSFNLVRFLHRKGGCQETGAFVPNRVCPIPDGRVLLGGWIADDGSPEFLVRNASDFFVRKLDAEADTEALESDFYGVDAGLQRPSLRRVFYLIGKGLYYHEKRGSQATTINAASPHGGAAHEAFCRTIEYQNGSVQHEVVQSAARIENAIGNLMCSVGAGTDDPERIVAWCDNGHYALQNCGTCLNHVEGKRRKLPWPHQKMPGPVWRTPFGAATVFESEEGEWVWWNLCDAAPGGDAGPGA